LFFFLQTEKKSQGRVREDLKEREERERFLSFFFPFRLLSFFTYFSLSSLLHPKRERERVTHAHADARKGKRERERARVLSFFFPSSSSCFFFVEEREQKVFIPSSPLLKRERCESRRPRSNFNARAESTHISEQQHRYRDF